jgi:type IV pilus assembly protein PilN
MRVTVNLATRPYADLRPALKRLRIAMAALAVLAAGLGLALHFYEAQAAEARLTSQNLESRINLINNERQGYQKMMNRPENLELMAQVDGLNQHFEEKTFSWTLAMEELETVLPGGVQVVNLDPQRDQKSGRITLKLRVVGARDKADDLVQNLEHSRHFLQPHIVSESSESTGGVNERMEIVSASNRFNFELLADYNPAAGQDRPQKNTEEKKTEETKPKKLTPPMPHVPQMRAPQMMAPRLARPSPATPSLLPHPMAGGPR